MKTFIILLVLLFCKAVATEQKKEKYQIIRPVEPKALATLVELTDDTEICAMIGVKIIQRGDYLSRSFRIKNPETIMTIRMVFGPEPFLSISLKTNKGSTITLIDKDIDGLMDYTLVTNQNNDTRRIDKNDISSWLKLQEKYTISVKMIIKVILRKIESVLHGPNMD